MSMWRLGCIIITWADFRILSAGLMTGVALGTTESNRTQHIQRENFVVGLCGLSEELEPHIRKYC